MEKFQEYMEKYWKHMLALVIVLIVVYVLYLWWKKKDENTIKIVDDNGNPVQLTEAQINEATAIADRINKDLNSGWFFGYNFTGFGPVQSRDVEAYTALAQMSDTMFAATCQKYQEKYNSSLIADIRAENSIIEEPQVKIILDKATRLKIA